VDRNGALGIKQYNLRSRLSLPFLLQFRSIFISGVWVIVIDSLMISLHPQYPTKYNFIYRKNKHRRSCSFKFITALHCYEQSESLEDGDISVHVELADRPVRWYSEYHELLRILWGWLCTRTFICRCDSDSASDPENQVRILIFTCHQGMVNWCDSKP
jgi:hypothetical protein